MTSNTQPKDDPRLYEIEHLTSVDPDSRALRDVFRILSRVTDPGTEVARCFDPYTAARITAVLEAWDRMSLSTVGMPLACPSCGAYESDVKDSRRTDKGFVRRRACSACKATFKTVERVTSIVVKGEEI